MNKLRSAADRHKTTVLKYPSRNVVSVIRVLQFFLFLVTRKAVVVVVVVVFVVAAIK
jgi:hypothetical protein